MKGLHQIKIKIKIIINKFINPILGKKYKYSNSPNSNLFKTNYEVIYIINLSEKIIAIFLDHNLYKNCIFFTHFNL